MKIKFLSTYDKAKNLMHIINQAVERNKQAETIINKANMNVPAYKKNTLKCDTFVSGSEKAEK